MKVHICNHMRKDIVVHKIGCADIQRDKKRGLLNSDWLLEIPNDTTVVAAVVDDLNESFGWTAGDAEPQPWHDNDVTIMPCCKDIGKGTAASAETVKRIQKKFNSAPAQQKEQTMKKKDIKATVAKNNAKVRAAMKATGVVVGEAITPDQLKNLQSHLDSPSEKGMTFNLFTDKTKKAKRTLHTPSCKAGDRLKKRATFKKVIAATADDAAHIEGKDIVFDTNGDFVESDIKIHTCCKLFRTVKTSNPPCPHCGNAKTVFRSNIGVGKGKKSSEFTCVGCKKMFVYSKPKTNKEKVMKIKISKKTKKQTETKDAQEQMAARKGPKTKNRKASKERAAKRAEKRAARMEARKAKREAKKAERVARREERQKARLGRMFDRASKFLARLEKAGVKTGRLENELGVARQDAGLESAKKSKKSKRSKK